MSDLNDIQHELQAVLGYYELGMWDEALAEVAEVESRIGTRVELNELRLVVLQGAKQWETMRLLAQQCAETEPTRASWFISWAFALRRERSIAAAQKVLETALPLHPREALIPFNLACYSAQLGDLPHARKLLARALELDPQLQKNAQEDPDLEPIRNPGNPSLASAPLQPMAVPPTPILSRPPVVPPAALRHYTRNLIEGDSTARAVALHALVEAKAEAVFTALFGSEDPVIVQLAARGLWECWFNEAGAGPRAVLEKGIAAMEAKDYEAAAATFRELIEQYPLWAEAINKLATLRYLQKDYAESIGLCRRVVALKPDHFGAWQGIALCAVQLEDWMAALEAARQTLRLQPRQPSHLELVKSLENKLAS